MGKYIYFPKFPHCAQEARVGGDEKINIYLQNKSMSLREGKKKNKIKQLK